jgi:hypothetical protein
MTNVTITEKKDIIDIAINQDVFEVIEEKNTVAIKTVKDVIEVTEEPKEAIRINVTDVIFSVEPIGSRYEAFTPTYGQTIFTLSATSTGAEILLSKVFINGQKINYPNSYSISGSQLTITLPYDLEVSDILETYY